MEAQSIGEIMPGIANLVQATQELKPLKTGDEGRLEIALKSRLIKDATFEEIKEPLRLVMMKVGIRAQNMPNDLEKLVLFQHIQENYGGHNVDEIRLAFDMAIAGKLDLKQDDVKCYENFSCMYVSFIMNAYRDWSAQAYKQVHKDEPPPQKIFTQDELDDKAREDVEVQYGYFLKGHRLRGTEFNIPILVKDGLIKESELLEDFFMRMVKKGLPHIYVKQPSK